MAFWIQQLMKLPFEYDYLDPFFYSFTDGVIATKNKKVDLLRIDSLGIIHTRIPIAYDDIWVEQETFKIKVKVVQKQITISLTPLFSTWLTMRSNIFLKLKNSLLSRMENGA